MAARAGVELEWRLARSKEGMQFVQLVTRTFASLRLDDTPAIADTASSLSTTFLGAGCGATITMTDDGGLEVVGGAQGFADPAGLVSGEARGLWDWVLEEKVARQVSRDELAARWPSAPDELGGGFACVAMDVRDTPRGIILVARKLDGTGFMEEDLEFLSCVAGIASMAFVNSEAHAAQKALVEQAEQEALQKERALEELDRKLGVIERQREAIRELSTPVLRLWDEVLALPIIGVIDSRRTMEIMETLLSSISAQQAHYVILDITGVEVVDTKTADYLFKVVKAAHLLGARCVLTGIQPAVAQTLVDIGIDLAVVATRGTLMEGLEHCLLLREERGKGRGRPAGRGR